MTKDEALLMCLEYIEKNAHERKYVRHAIKHALETQRTWVGLTDEDFYGQSELQVMAMKYAEAKLKEKNT